MPDASPNLVLMGLRGSGKSTLGGVLGVRLGRGVVDLDERTLARLGCATASDAFATLGEGAFRRAEIESLREVLRTSAQIVALGGGTPTAPGAAELLRGERDGGRATIVYLHASPDALRRRLAGTDMANRPGLLGGDPLAEIDAVYAARDPLYRSLASAVVEVAGPEAEGVVDAIERLARGG
ncbi:MAG: shikimate kinase [Phycisphaerales bacterium]